MTTSQLHMTIGAVSKATGIPVNTLRTWERRYEFPVAERSDGGQRLYATSVVPHLNLINQAIKNGMRARQVVGLSFDELQSILGQSTPPKPTERNEVQEWVDAAKKLDGSYLDSCFQSSISQLGVQRFLTDKLVPFIHELGQAWASGKIQIFHEHFASERIHDFLTKTWRPLSDRATGPNVICASLPEENHFLGLHMAATIMALYGFRIIFLGPKTPLQDILECTWQSSASAILISISSTSPPEKMAEQATALRAALSPNIELVLGGRGAPFLKGVSTLNNLAELSAWAIQNRS